MRWERLFADLEAQLEAEESAAYAAEITERTRIAVGSISLRDRLRTAEGRQLQLTVQGVGAVDGTLRAVGSEWLVVTGVGGADLLVVLAAVTGVRGLGALAAPPGSEGEVAARFRLRHALRAVSRDRSACRITLVDQAIVVGTIDRVGADFLDVAEHPAGEARRPGAVRGVRTVPVTAIALVQTR